MVRRPGVRESWILCLSSFPCLSETNSKNVTHTSTPPPPQKKRKKKEEEKKKTSVSNPSSLSLPSSLTHRQRHTHTYTQFTLTNTDTHSYTHTHMHAFTQTCTHIPPPPHTHTCARSKGTAEEEGYNFHLLALSLVGPASWEWPAEHRATSPQCVRWVSQQCAFSAHCWGPRCKPEKKRGKKADRLLTLITKSIFYGKITQSTPKWEEGYKYLLPLITGWVADCKD